MKMKKFIFTPHDQAWEDRMINPKLKGAVHVETFITESNDPAGTGNDKDIVVFAFFPDKYENKDENMIEKIIKLFSPQRRTC